MVLCAFSYGPWYNGPMWLYLFCAPLLHFFLCIGAQQLSRQSMHMKEWLKPHRICLPFFSEIYLNNTHLTDGVSLYSLTIFLPLSSPLYFTLTISLSLLLLDSFQLYRCIPFVCSLNCIFPRIMLPFLSPRVMWLDHIFIFIFIFLMCTAQMKILFSKDTHNEWMNEWIETKNTKNQCSTRITTEVFRKQQGRNVATSNQFNIIYVIRTCRRFFGDFVLAV